VANRRLGWSSATPAGTGRRSVAAAAPAGSATVRCGDFRGNMLILKEDLAPSGASSLSCEFCNTRRRNASNPSKHEVSPLRGTAA
jgi:hypothetical protein